MKRLTLFVKGNVDVRDSLHFCRIGGELVWNGINEVLREHRVKSLVRIKHETWTRSDALLESAGTVPEAFTGHDLPLGPYSLASQFSNAIFTAPCDAVILSIQPDVTMSLMRHRRDGFLFYPIGAEAWPAGDRAWLQSNYEASGLLGDRAAFRKQRNFDHRCRHDRGAAWRRRAEARRRPFEAARLLAGGQGSGAVLDDLGVLETAIQRACAPA